MACQIETANELFGKYLYPPAKVIMEAQQNVVWTAQEIDIEKDVMDYKVNMNKYQFNLASTTLDTFVQIEQHVGTIWSTIATWFPHSEIEGACSFISAMETSVHAFFYQKMNDVMNIPPEETLKKQQETKEIRAKLAMIDSIMSDMSANKPLTLATVLLVEQVLLFGNFAMLKTFQANGYNLITNTITGLDFVISDEDLHGEFAAYLFNVYVNELGKTSKDFEEDIKLVATQIVEHEYAIINLIFKDVNSINHTTAEQFREFIKHRVNRALEQINIKPMYTVNNTAIQEWFYRSNNSMKIHDFFVSGTSSYTRDWSSDKLSRVGLHVK